MFTEALRLERAFHSRSQTFNPVFEYTVPYAALHDLNSFLLTQTSGEENERNVPSALMQQLKRTRSVELRQGVIRENDVEIGMQVGEIFRFRTHAQPSGIKTGAAQFMHD